MRQPIFLYGTLLDPSLLATVAGTGLNGTPARISSHSVVSAIGEDFPLIIRSEFGHVDGRLIEPTDLVWRRLGFYELGFGYRLQSWEVEVDGALLEAMVYVPEAGRWTAGPPWSLAQWQGQHGPLARTAAVEYMRLFDVLDPAEAAEAFPQIRSRANSRLAAQAAPSPAELEPLMTTASPIIERTAQPYTDYFAVREDWLRFPRFDGTHSGVVKRASFMGGDAVTVLPWDPATDNVLLVRQFRHGAFARGDTNPWSLEPVAGRIDAGEAAESTAHREMEEESHLTARSLHRIGGYYPSPGAYSEHLTSFIAVADLSGRDGTTGGLDDEAEDIMSHVLPLSRVIEMIASGAANTAPLILSALWLDAHKERLRREAPL